MRDAVTVCYAVRLRVFTVTALRVIAITSPRAFTVKALQARAYCTHQPP